ncbi:MAG TPA: ATP-grasp domain-containing protein [bacterium]|jgi:predicted ATP-grasp superfamily ATP-dependent carboligase|nr:ATP-grasp domain-containing protein [bacterium]HRQ70051.1 ATP-grasp domain-containing protein [bacterium]
MNKYKNHAVICGSYVNALGLARSLGAEGIAVTVIDYTKNISFYSKYVHGIVCPKPDEDEEGFISFLIDLGHRFDEKPVIFVTNDIWLIPVSRNGERLSKYYHIPMSDWEIIKQCSDKTYMYKIAEENNIPYPKTLFLEKSSQFLKKEHSLKYPVILKPSVTIGFSEKLKSYGRSLEFKDQSSAENWIDKIRNAQLDDVPVVVQEMIPGGAENLFTFTSYSRKGGETVAYSTGHKIRQSPPHAGTIISGHVIPNKDVIENGINVIKKMKFDGIANTEFKYDHRDGLYKLIEINPRPGMWNFSVMASGINLPLYAYLDSLGIDYKPVKSSDKELNWVFWSSDLYYSLFGFKKMGFPEYSLTLCSWWKSLKGKKVSAVFSLMDIKPALFLFSSFFYSKLKRFF